MKKTSNHPTPNYISCITELGLTGKLLSIRTKYPDEKGILELDTSTGIGRSGMWRIAESRNFDYVVLRVGESGTLYKIYTGRFQRLSSVTGMKKKIVVFDKLAYAGISDTISRVFNDGKSSRDGKTYISVPSAADLETEESQATEGSQIFREGSVVLVTARPDQSPFAKAVRKNCKNRCVITGATMQWRTEAAHLIPYRDKGIPDVTNGLLLRRDIHALFDQGHCAINPENMTMFFSFESRQQDKDLKKLHSFQIKRNKLEKPINTEYLKLRWEAFLKKHGAESL